MCGGGGGIRPAPPAGPRGSVGGLPGARGGGGGPPGIVEDVCGLDLDYCGVVDT